MPMVNQLIIAVLAGPHCWHEAAPSSRSVVRAVKEHLDTARAAWKRRAEQVPEEGAQDDQEQQERDQPPAVDGITPIQEGINQGNDGEALPLNEGALNCLNNLLPIGVL